VDAVLITHPHADAYMGLDDLRDVSPRAVLPVYTSQSCYDQIARAFPYLTKPHEETGLFIARLEWHIIREFVPFCVEGLTIVPVPVEHGHPGPMLAFEFWAGRAADDSSGGEVAAENAFMQGEGAGTGDPTNAGSGSGAVIGTAPSPQRSLAPTPVGAAGTDAGTDARPPDRTARVVYISDVSGFDALTRGYLRTPLLPRIDTLVLDALSYLHYSTHFSIAQSIAASIDVEPQLAVYTGMGHRMDYYAENAKLLAYARARNEGLAGALERRRRSSSSGSGHGLSTDMEIEEPVDGDSAEDPARFDAQAVAWRRRSSHIPQPVQMELGFDGWSTRFVLPYRSKEDLQAVIAELQKKLHTRVGRDGMKKPHIFRYFTEADALEEWQPHMTVTAQSASESKRVHHSAASL
jgi:phosphoribosyl 1,2-cyclic phosphodiesterase